MTSVITGAACAAGKVSSDRMAISVGILGRAGIISVISPNFTAALLPDFYVSF
jgi:hypothetical protein